jgi:hypothetical protein
MSFWTPIENPGTRPPRSWVFDVGCVLFAAMASFGSFSFAQTAHPAHPPLAVSLVVAVLTTLVLPLRRVWPGPVFGVVVLMAAVLAHLAGSLPGGWQDGNRRPSSKTNAQARIPDDHSRH